MKKEIEQNEEMPELPPKCEECNNMAHKKLYFNDEYIYLCDDCYEKIGNIYQSKELLK